LINEDAHICAIRQITSQSIAEGKQNTMVEEGEQVTMVEEPGKCICMYQDDALKISSSNDVEV